MATKKQITANRRNALKSTGPRTPRGKAAVRLNALRHGLRAGSGILSPESLAELSQIRTQFLHAYQPQTPEQIRLVEQMACAHWQLLHWQRAETHFLGQDHESDPLSHARALDGFSQRQARYQRAFTKAFRLYLQSTRASAQAGGPPPA